MQSSFGWSRALAVLVAAGCSGNTPTGGSAIDDGFCSIPQSEIFGVAGRDGIPALSNPRLVAPDDPTAGYLLPDDRVIGLFLGDEVVAIPLNIMWWHEIVNIEMAGHVLAVTHCPLTGSTIAFDREPLGGVEFGVSGLLYLNNLIMFDRSNEASLWPQLSRGARCGPLDGTGLTTYPVVESSWAWWTTLHPDTRVVSGATGFIRDYTQYPYGSYDVITNPQTLIQVELDLRRPPKERVLGIPSDAGGTAYPFLELASLGTLGVVDHLGGPEAVIFWDARAQSAMAYVPHIDGMDLTFAVQNGVVQDNETGSTWQVDGVATFGPLTGQRLEGLAEAYVAFWFGWAAFEPNTSIWLAP